MSTTNRMYDRLCKLYHLVLVRMRKLEAVRAFPPLSQFRQSVVQTVAGHRLEQLEARVLLSGAPTLPGMHLTSDDTTNWQGQVIFLDFDGAQDVTYDGPVQIGPFDVAPYQAPASQSGQEATIAADVLNHLQTTFADTGVIFTLIEPVEGDYSTLYVGGDDTAFHAHGRFTALAEAVDTDNQNVSDEAWVFTQGLATSAQLIELVQHEVSHLLGYAHDQTPLSPALLSDVAVNTYRILHDQALINQNAGIYTILISRMDTLTTETVYASTIQDQGDVNEGIFIDLDHQPITFQAGQSVAEISISINDLGLFNGNTTFSLIVQASDVPASPVVASSTFSIVNNATMFHDVFRKTGISSHDASIVNYIPQMLVDNIRFVGLQLAPDNTYLTSDVAAQLQAAGIDVYSIYEQEGMRDTDANGNHTHAWQDYFTHAQGQADAAAAYAAATQIAQQPYGSAIYFSLNLNPADTVGITQLQALDRISLYFQGIQDYFSTLPAEATYTIGIMGAGDTLTRVTGDGLAEYTWLALANDWPGYDDWNWTNNLPAESNITQGKLRTNDSSYGSIPYHANSNWAKPLGAWNELVAPYIQVSDADIRLPVSLVGQGQLALGTFNLSGVYLDGHTLTLTAPAGVSIGISGVYAATHQVTPTDGYLRSTRVSLRADAAVAGDYAGELLITSDVDSSVNKSIRITGTVVDQPDYTPPVVDYFEAVDADLAEGEPVTLAYSVTENGGAGLKYVRIYRYGINSNGGIFGGQVIHELDLDETTNLYEGTLSSVLSDTPASGHWRYILTVIGGTNYGAESNHTVILDVIVQDQSPVISGIIPATGSILGGTEVTITGQHFTDTTAVHFGDSAAISFTVDSDTQITAIAPAHSISEDVSVTVTTSQGVSLDNPDARFEYLPLQANLTAYKPETWPDALILTHNPTILDSNRPLLDTDWFYLSWTGINSGQAPSNAAFSVKVFVDGVERLVANFPADIQPEETFAIDSMAIGTLSAGDHEIRIEIDSGDYVAETNENDNSYSRIFTIYENNDATSPTVDTFSVDQTLLLRGHGMTFTYNVSDSGGAGLRNLTLLQAEDVNGSPGTFYARLNHTFTLNDDQMEGTLYNPGYIEEGVKWFSLMVSDRNGNSSTSHDAGILPIKITFQSEPRIDSLSATTGNSDGGYSIVIHGDDLNYATDVRFGDIPASSFTIDSNWQITAIVPAALVAGQVNVIVETPVGTSTANEASTFEYYQSLPELQPHQPAGWAGEMVVANQPGAFTSPAEYLDNQELFLSWAIINAGDAVSTAPYKTYLYVDDELYTEWVTTSPLQISDVFIVEDFNLGMLSAGTHELRLVIDPENVVDEYDDSENNVFTTSITVNLSPNTPPDLLELSTPLAPQYGDIAFTYVLKDEESNAADIAVQYSLDDGVTWLPATAAAGGDGTSGLATSPEGVTYTYMWESTADVQYNHLHTVRLRITPSDARGQGTAVTTSAFEVNQPPTLLDINATTEQFTQKYIYRPTFQNAFNDLDSNDSMKFVRFTSLPEHGTLTIDGSAVVLGEEYDIQQLIFVKYLPEPAHTGSDHFTWNASDGSLYASQDAQVNLTITPQIAFDTTFDFGTETSPLEAGATRVTETTSYSLNQGYGWSWGYTVVSRDRGVNSSMNRDLNATAEGEFFVNVENGYYQVTVNLGDAGPYQHDQMGVFLQGALVDTVTTGPAQVVARTYTVLVDNGLLNLRLKDLGGTDPSVVITGLRIQNTLPPVQYPPTLSDITLAVKTDVSTPLNQYDFLNAFSDPNSGDGLKRIKIVSLPSHGKLMLVDNEIVAGQFLGGVSNVRYVPDAGYAGPDSFTWNASDGALFAENDAQVNITVIAPAAYDTTFDFGTSSSPLLTGAVRVLENTSYNNSRGFGWQTGSIVSRDRGESSALNRDFNATNDGTFAVDLANGFYNVTVHLGETDPYIRDQMGVFFEGAQVDSVNAPLGQIATRTYSVQVTDGQLNLRLKDLGGSDPSVVIAGLRILSSQPPAEAPPTLVNVNQSMEVNATLSLNAAIFQGAFNDPNPGDSLQQIRILSLPSMGTLRLNGIAITVNQEIPVSQLDSLVYTPNQPLPGSDSFSWTASDGSQFATSPATVNITLVDPFAYDTTFDFGTTSSPLQQGAVRVSENTSYNATRGYGWQTSGIVSRSRANGSDMTRDFNATSDGTFAVDLVNGYYKVTVHLGDTDPYLRDQMGVHLEGSLVESVTAPLGQVTSHIYIVNITDGQLNLRLKDLGGIDSSVVIAGLQIESSGPPVAYPPVVADINQDVEMDAVLNFSASDFAAGFSDPNPGDSLQKIRIVSLPNHGQLMLSGQVVSIDQEINQYQLTQLTYTPAAGYTGSDSFTWNGADATQYANTDAQVLITITAPLPYEATFDFGTSSSSLQSGALRVSENTTYNTSRGYGWQSGTIVSRDRGGSNAMDRDLNATADGTFAVDLADGLYRVTIHLGDVANYQHDEMGVYLEDAFRESVTPQLGQVLIRTYTLSVIDGQLNLRLLDMGGIDPSVVITGLHILELQD